jgi:hypothetical protein
LPDDFDSFDENSLPKLEMLEKQARVWKSHFKNGELEVVSAVLSDLKPGANARIDFLRYLKFVVQVP